ncbi:TrkA family potassium uptake protein [Salinirubellus salinus]|jgi:trk system potassium uptake protein TrkA|uniref:TrkA family potassium uptake protein n=1 Tax=Salinirubellus salinus TaxID=1364945 RepID=A0A9E7QZC9_9EURY|nr:TrkA family potassium uptake protein [Salinirubellus salinus]UWM52826.1 TrkA family potassium uptake protein [Salinirubellus salinus]
MRFIIVGAGRVGMRTARVLREEDHEVVLVEPQRARVERLAEEGFTVVEGDGSDEEVLLDLDLDSADGLAALTGDLTVNFVACMIAKAHDCRTVLRADSDYREYVVRKYSQDVDEVVYPERLGAVVAKNALLGGNIHAIADISPTVQLVELTVTESSPVRGYTLSEVELPADARLLGFGKAGGRMNLPEPDQSLELGDRVIVIADYDVLQDVRQLVVGQTAPVAAAGGV